MFHIEPVFFFRIILVKMKPIFFWNFLGLIKPIFFQNCFNQKKPIFFRKIFGFEKPIFHVHHVMVFSLLRVVWVGFSVFGWCILVFWGVVSLYFGVFGLVFTIITVYVVVVCVGVGCGLGCVLGSYIYIIWDVKGVYRMLKAYMCARDVKCLYRRC